MRIIEWNCQGAFRKKYSRILSFNPDILVISECESENKLKFGVLTPTPNDFLWYGVNENKGIGIFSYSDYKFELLKIFNPRFKYIIPIKVTGNETSFLLFAIWTQENKQRPNERYIGQIWLALSYYSNLLSLPIILTGDFNSNTVWDRKNGVGNHSDVVNVLNNNKIYSLYHRQEHIQQGFEIHPTFYLHRKRNKPYHIDYFFASEVLVKNGFQITIGQADNWLDVSDHVPLILDFKPDVFADFENSISEFIKLKLDKLSIFTKSKFSTLINNIIREANCLEKYPATIKYHPQREKLIQKLEKLIEIDKLLIEINQ